MLGSNHATMGAIAGAATCPDGPVPYRVAWIGTWAAASMWADFDTKSSSASLTFGPLTQGASSMIGTLAGGHRWGTHDVILAPSLLATLVMPWALSTTPGRYVIVALLLGLALRTLLPDDLTSLGPRGESLVSLSAAAIAAALATVWATSHGYSQGFPTTMPVLGHITHSINTLAGWIGLPLQLLWRVLLFAFALGIARSVLQLLPASLTAWLSALAVTLTGTWWLVSHNLDQTLPLASIVACGIIVHCLGDLPTTEGLPIPVLWIFTRRARFSLGLFDVGGPVERRMVAPVLSGILLLALDQRFGFAWMPFHLAVLPHHAVPLPF